MAELVRKTAIKTPPAPSGPSAEAEAWERARQWAEENKAFTDSYAAWIEEHGAFGEDVRGW